MKHIAWMLALLLAFAGCLPASAVRAENMPSATEADGTEPVSYTHLDVYKRQDQK